MTSAISEFGNTRCHTVVLASALVEMQCNAWDVGTVGTVPGCPAGLPVIDRFPSCGRSPLWLSTKRRFVELSMKMAGLTSTRL
jgi:hypothetical protein